MTNYTTPPEHTFLSKREVIEPYDWGRTEGYQVMADPDFPRAIQGRYRLDTLIAREEQQLAGEHAPRMGRNGDLSVQPALRRSVAGEDLREWCQLDTDGRVERRTP
jgi:hypothetical protein